MRPIHIEPGLAVGEQGSLCVVIWRLDVTPERFVHQRNALRDVAHRHPGRAAFLCVIEPSAKPPSEELRRASVAMLTELRAQLSGVAAVIEGSGFEAAVTRSVLAGMMLLLRSFTRENIVFCATVREGLVFLAKGVTDLDVTALEAATAALRARLPPLA